MLTFLLLIILVCNIITCCLLIKTNKYNKESKIQDIINYYNSEIYKDVPTLKRLEPGIYMDDKYLYTKNFKIKLEDINKSFKETCDKVFNKK